MAGSFLQDIANVSARRFSIWDEFVGGRYRGLMGWWGMPMASEKGGIFGAEDKYWGWNSIVYL